MDNGMRRFSTIFSVAAGFLVLLTAMHPIFACVDGSPHFTRGSSGDSRHDNPTPDVEFDSERNALRVTSQGQTMDQVLAAISDKTNIRFTRYAQDCEQVHIHFDLLPLEEALAKMLKDRNYVLSHPAQGTIEVWVLPAGDSNTQTATDIVTQEFYNEFKGHPAAEQFAEELKSVEPELSGIQTFENNMLISERGIPLDDQMTDRRSVSAIDE